MRTKKQLKNKGIDKRLKQKEVLEAEIERSMSVVREKQAHMQIEEVKKIRKKPAILSIIDRIDTNFGVSYSVFEHRTCSSQLSHGIMIN